MNRVILTILIFCFVGLFHSDGQETIVQDIGKEFQSGLDAIAAYQYEDAMYHMYNCLRMDPDNLTYNKQVAFCYVKLGNYTDAKRIYRKILKIDDNNVNALSNLALIFDKEMNFYESANHYQKLLAIDSTNSYYYKQYAFVEMKKGNALEAIQLLGKAHTLNPKDIIVINEMSNLYLSMEALEYAENMIDKGIQLDSNNIKLLYTQSKIKNKNKDYPAVINALEKVLIQKDTNAYYQMMLSVALLQEDSIDKALFHLNHIVTQQKDNEHTHHYLALAYREKEEKELSTTHFEKAIELAISPKLSLYHKDLATLYEEEKQYKKAIKHYQEAYDHSGKEVYLFHLARAHDFYYKDKKMALRLYRKYLKSKHGQYRDYATERTAQLKEIIHFQK